MSTFFFRDDARRTDCGAFAFDEVATRLDPFSPRRGVWL